MKNTRNNRMLAIVVGVLLLLPGLGLLVGGGSLGLVSAFGRDSNGYFTQPASLIDSSSAAVTTNDLAFVLDPQSPSWVAGMLDTSVRLRATATDPGRTIFVGVSSTSDLDRYLSGVRHDVMGGTGASPTYRTVAGDAEALPPGTQSFWVTKAQGSGMQELTWRPGSGHWSLAVVNADGSPGVAAKVTLGVKVGFLLPLTLLLLAAGAAFTTSGALLVRHGVKEQGRSDSASPSATPTPSGGSAPQLSSAGTSTRDRNQS